MTTKTIDTTDLRNNMSDALKVVSDGQTLVIKKRGKAQAAIIDIDTYEDLLAASNPQNLQAIKEARAQYEHGEVLSFDEVFGDI